MAVYMHRPQAVQGANHEHNADADAGDVICMPFLVCMYQIDIGTLQTSLQMLRNCLETHLTLKSRHFPIRNTQFGA